MAANPSIQLGTDGNWAIKEDNLLAYKKDGTRFFNKEFDFSRGSSATFIDKDGLIKVSGVTNTELVTNGGFDTDTNWTKGNGAYISEGKGNVIGDGSSFTNLSQSNVFTVGKFYKVTLDAVINSGLGLKVQDGSTNENFGFITTSGTYTFYSEANDSSLVIGRRTGGTAFDSYIDNVSIVEIQLDVPRIDFKNNTTGHLLLEPQSTNLITYSEDFSSSSWHLNGGTLTTNSGISPDGNNNAYKYNTDGSYKIFRQLITLSTSTDYTFSFYAKNVDATDAFYRVHNNSNATDVISATSYISQINNSEWNRVEVNFTTDSTGTQYAVYLMSGNSGGDILFWGAQTEELPYATSYIPTSGSTVTRNAEVCNNSGSLQDFNSEEGVLYAEISALADDGTFRYITLNDGTDQNVVAIRFSETSNQILAFTRISGSFNAVLSTTSYSTVNFNKIAYRYKSGDFGLFINGTKISSSTSTQTLPANTLNTLSFDNAPFAKMYGKAKGVYVFNEALTDDELQQLTT